MIKKIWGIELFPTWYGDGGGSCCVPSNQCGENEGDCDEDIDCFGNLKCGTNNCDPRLGFGKSTDCCYDPNKVWSQ